MKLKLVYQKQSLEINVSPTKTLQDLQETITNEWKLESIKVIYAGVVLKGNLTLEGYDIKDRSKLMVMGQKIVHKQEKELETLEAEFQSLVERFEQLDRILSTHSEAFKKTEFMYKEINELLLQLLLKVDKVQGDEGVRKQRKELVTQINSYLDKIDTLKPKLAKWKAEL